MSVFLARGGAAAAVIVVSAQAAMADLSAQMVWEDWKSYLTSTGYAITGTETETGGALTVSDVVMSLPVAEDDGSARISLPEIKFVENGDGTVNVLLPAEFPLGFDMTIDGDSLAGNLIYAHDGGPMTVTGSAEEMSYDYASDAVSITLDSLRVEGEDIPADAVMARIVLNGLATETSMQTGGTRVFDQTMSVAALNYELGFNSPENGDTGQMKGVLNGLDFTGSSTVPMGMNSADTRAILEAGLAFDGRFTFASGSGTISGTDGNETFSLESSSDGGVIETSMDRSHLAYDLSQTGTKVNITASDIPFPLALSMAEAGIKMMVPLEKTEEEQDFALGISLRDLVLPEMLWGMVDPTGQLPHDPATLVVDLAGKGKVLFDIFDPESAQEVEQGNAQPGELNALTVKQLQVSAAGAELTGTGDFTFDNDDLTSFDGMPAPSGAADLKLTGANALIDKLIQMGLLSDSDAMGARMMMGMLAVPGEGEDTLTSKIEISGDGQIRANGQRIK